MHTQVLGTQASAIDPGQRGLTLRSVPAPERHEELWLLGQPPLWKYLDFAEHSTTTGAQLDRSELAEEWRIANDYYQELERTQAGIANSGAHRELEAEFAPQAAQVRAHPHYRRAFDTLPTSIMQVELDKLIVTQTHVTRTFVERLVARIGSAPELQTLFRLCLPLETPTPSVQICSLGSHRYVFRCESTDLRFHETTVLRPQQLVGYHSFGTVAAVLGIVVGFGCDFFNGVRVGNRIVLHNGYHRAVALRTLGLTHAPCIVQTATRVDEIQAAVKGRAAENPEFYFESARPPLLQDFFDARLRKILPLRAQTQLVEVKMEIKHLVENPIVAK
ncbi:hypothetical protein GCM10011487_15870 [Steroidobacter agaridevorans]|uniref:Uncharacterized protein n=1 Tax=Steroidobacter agaridevorans TaxID=2695856 RepID=A0A829Y8G3_9GAMM|nr:hypothetical protein [Steroidobacter agaridevorans]GFE79587.1 hypothetical protein GCM10011487_15870 [Steroidobacter agaridevorans]GFE88592.1 hypothetical protein GCM10011488_35460 [Steroidobacter agaridevorans]